MSILNILFGTYTGRNKKYRKYDKSDTNRKNNIRFIANQLIYIKSDKIFFRFANYFIILMISIFFFYFFFKFFFNYLFIFTFFFFNFVFIGFIGQFLIL